MIKGESSSITNGQVEKILTVLTAFVFLFKNFSETVFSAESVLQEDSVFQ